MVTVMKGEAREIPKLLKKLQESAPPAGGVLTVSLDTSPTRIQSRDYKLALREMARQLRATLPKAGQADFDMAVGNAEWLAGEATPGRRGLVIYAATQPTWGGAVRIPVRTADRLIWSPQPDLEPLRRVADQHERVGLVIFDTAGSRLMTVHFGEIESSERVEAPREDPTPYRGHDSWGQQHMQRREQVDAARHARATAAEMLETLRNRPFDRLFLSGNGDGVALLEHALPKPLRQRMAGTIKLDHHATDAQILDAVIAASEIAEERMDVVAVAALAEARVAPNVVMGLTPVLEAVAQGRMARLLLADDVQLPGGACPECGRLVAGSGACPTCGAEMVPLESLRGALVDRVYHSGGTVEFISGEANTQLMAMGGLGGWTWF